MKNKLNRRKNPYYEHSEAKYFIAENDGKVLGRIVATVNNRHNEFHKENIGFFGFFECVEDQEIANALFDKAVEYLRNMKVDLVRGPANLTSNDDWGLLLNAFDAPPMVMMPYNPPYYRELIENYGFKKVMDLYAYWQNTDDVSDKAGRVAEKIKSRSKVSFRKINIKDWDNEVKRIRRIYNEAWSLNWGFVPMTESEFNHLAKDLKMILDPDFIIIAEDGDRPVGFSLTLPDVNQALKKINGKLLPFGIIRLLYNLKKIKTVRVITMGLIPEYHKKGLDSVLYFETLKAGKRKGIIGGELSWVLETNEMMNRIAQSLGARIYKTYRLYDYVF